MPPLRIVVVGTSSGGIEALTRLVSALPPHLPAAVCVVMHTAPESPGVLPDILSRAGVLPASTAVNGERFAAGRIYVAPPDRHLMVEPGRLLVTHGPKENRFRPAIDPLFRSAAQVGGPAVIGVILTGNLDDGTAGLSTVKQLGGLAIVQDPKTAMFPAMPTNAMRHVDVDYCVPLDEIGPLLASLTEVETEQSPVPAPLLVGIEVK